MSHKNLAIKEETVILLNRARATLQNRNPKKRYYDDDVINHILTEFLYNNIPINKKVKPCKKKKPSPKKRVHQNPIIT